MADEDADAESAEMPVVCFGQQVQADESSEGQGARYVC